LGDLKHQLAELAEHIPTGHPSTPAGLSLAAVQEELEAIKQDGVRMQEQFAASAEELARSKAYAVEQAAQIKEQEGRIKELGAYRTNGLKLAMAFLFLLGLVFAVATVVVAHFKSQDITEETRLGSYATVGVSEYADAGALPGAVVSAVDDEQEEDLEALRMELDAAQGEG